MVGGNLAVLLGRGTVQCRHHMKTTALLSAPKAGPSLIPVDCLDGSGMNQATSAEGVVGEDPQLHA